MTASQHDDNNDSAVMDAHTDTATDDTTLTTLAADEGRELFAMPPDAQTSTATLGARLRAAREVRGLTVDEVGLRLRLPQRVIASLESGDFARIEHDVYLRGYLASYMRLLDIPAQELGDELARERAPTQPPLVATGRISHSRYLFQRYSVPAVYVVLTGLIVAPAIWLASHGGLERNLARVATLDGGTESAVALPPDPSAPAAASATTPDTTPVAPTQGPPTPMPHADAPLMASMALPTMKHEPAPAPAAPPVSSQAGTGAYQMRLKLTEASWVEILAADGRRIEFGLLPAGAERTYGTDQAVSVRLGNANGAELDVNGKPVDLASFRRANVAYLKLVDGSPVTPAPANN
ncbi:MAG TPA: RodZ domain-containing protein [Tahibacter sp.]|nr:RodZ domain-containing protein [Tahibacter sp.]